MFEAMYFLFSNSYVSLADFVAFFSVCFPENKIQLVLFDFFVRNFDLSALSSKYKARLM